MIFVSAPEAPYNKNWWKVNFTENFPKFRQKTVIKIEIRYVKKGVIYLFILFLI